MSDNLAKFVAARLDDDKAFARTMTEVGNRQAAAATPGDIADAYGLAVGVLSDPQVMPLIERYMDGPILPPNNLERILREIEAKRAILGEYVAVRRLQELTDTEQDYYRDWVLCHLAAAWSDHPDYREEWKP